MREIVEGLFRNIPSGVGSHRKDLRLSQSELKQVLKRGAGWAVSQGYGSARDLDHSEEGGCLTGAQPDLVSARALERGRSQLGSIGSGNHFVEVDYVAEVYDEPVAQALGLFPDQITVTIHTGSRGLGYQVCDDSIKIMQRATTKYGISIPDRQLCCAPLSSPEAREYIGAMYSAANFAFANRQLATHWVRETFEQVLQRPPKDLRLEVIYDVCHNIGKFETHRVNGQPQRLCVHRKGATRALPPGHAQIPEIYRHLGQPVLIPGDMGRYSYVLIGTQLGGEETFSSSCHGAGRRMSRTQAKKSARGRPIVRELEDRGIYVRSAGRATLMEEIPEAYKDVSEVVDVVDGAGISKKVAQLRPMGVIKG
jgi:tRNA-splicing ligase RtcB